MNIRFGTQIAAAATAHGLDPRLLAAVAAQETGGPGSNSGNNIVGDRGHGHGVFQIDDRSWGFARGPAAMDPAKNADMAATILEKNLRTYGGNVRAALSAYNSGSPTATGSTTTWGDGATLGYADSVMRHYNALGGDPAQLLADNRETALGVNGLAKAAATAQFANPLPTAGGIPYTNSAPRVGFPFAAAAMGQQTSPPLTPTVSWVALSSASAADGASADKAMADLVDSGDIFGTGPSDDIET